MPYTPPSRSPATSNTNSPILSRNHSYDGSPNTARPGLPRSRSAAYIQMQRRAPSASDPATSTIHQSTSAIDHGLSASASASSSETHYASSSHIEAIDQLTGEAFLVESNESTDEDDDRSRRGRQIEILKNSLQTMVLPKRPGSPDRQKLASQADTMSSQSSSHSGSSSPGLTPEARKIAHSRSSSEIQLSKMVDVPSQAASSDDSDGDDDDLHMKPPLLRKKSGELVKPALRPPSRRRPSSMPGTPTFSKAVHFNEDIEQVRHFLQVDRPMAVSAGSSPVETYDSESEYPFNHGRRNTTTEWEIRASNFPADTHERMHAPLRVERIFLSADQKMLVGVVAVANIAFGKHVAARFTFDYWKTTSEVAAEYNYDVRKKETHDGYDRFNFNIKLSDQAHLESKTLLICVRYNVNGQEFWDNNNNINYQIDFVKKVVSKPAKPMTGAGALGAIPRSRHTPPTTLPRTKSFPASGDDEFSSTFEFTHLRGSKSRGRQGSLYPTQQRRGAPQQPNGGGPFTTRYDFSVGLSAALQRAAQAQAKATLDQQNPIARPAAKIPTPSIETSAAPRSDAPAVQPVNGSARAAAPMSTGRPELGSQEYHDLIQKFCYFGSKQGSPRASSPDATPKQGTVASTLSNAAQNDGSQSPLGSDSDVSPPTSAASSASNSPPSERVERMERAQLDGSHDLHRSSSRSSNTSFNTTSPRLIAQYRSSSPALGLEMPFQVLAQ